jgi:hypothetical protein
MGLHDAPREKFICLILGLNGRENTMGSNVAVPTAEIASGFSAPSPEHLQLGTERRGDRL